MVTCPQCRAEFGDEVETCPEHGLPLVPPELLVSAEPPIEPGTMVGEYRIDKKLGAGTFGDVYAGEQPLIGKRVAIKVLNRRFASDPVIVSRFVAEARAVNKIRQRNIIDIFSFGVVPGLDRHYFVMELLDGMTLGEALDRTGRLPVALVLPIVQGIADGLDAAHEAGITHRDLKPDNVYLVRERDGSYSPKLLDFGIAKLAGQEVAHKTSSGMVLGTPRYMSPEQSRGKPADHRSDIYALGVIVHEMLTGTFVFDAESAVDMLLKHALDEPPRMSSLCADIPTELDAPVLAMLAKRPADRPASAGEAVAALLACARELGLDRTTVTLGELATVARDTERSGPQFSRTTAVVSQPVMAERAQDAVSTRAATRPASSGAVRAALPSPQVTASDARTGPTTEGVSTLETSSAIRRQTRARRAAVVAGVVLAVVVGVVGVGVVRRDARGGMDGLPTPASAPRADVPAATAAPATTVSVMLWTRPADVDVWLGARRVGTSAGPLQLPRGGERIELRLRKEGFTDATVSLIPDHDQGIDATLSPPVAPKPSATAAAVAPAAKPAQGSGKMDRILGGRD